MKISIGAHVTFLALAMFGGPLFSAKNEKPFEVSQVAIISAEQFAEMNKVNSEPEVQEQSEPVVVETPKELDEPVGASDLDDLGVASNVEQQGRIENAPAEIAKPQQADRVSNEIFKAPEEPAPTVTENKAATVETVEPQTQEQPEQEQTAVRETTTEIVTEAEKEDRFVNPIKSVRPKGRPKDLAVVQPQEKPDPAVTNEQAQDIGDLLADAISEDQASQSAEPLSGVELQGLVFAVQQCWNVPIGMQNDDSNTVVLGISLNEDGTISGEPKRVEPLVNSEQINLAFETARRALIRCQPYALPLEKYDSWKEMEIVFNPAKMVQR